MTRPTLRERIPAALRLAPMTTRDLSLCLSAHVHTIGLLVEDLESFGVIRHVGKRGGRGRPWNVYAVAA